jgi:hypothetical protein
MLNPGDIVEILRKPLPSLRELAAIESEPEKIAASGRDKPVAHSREAAPFAEGDAAGAR